MTQLEIVFTGLCLFASMGGTGRTVVLPDLSAGMNVMTPRGATCVESHRAYISAPTAGVTCPDCEVIGERKILRLTGDVITITGVTNSAWIEDPTFNDLIPKLRKECPDFHLVIPENAAKFVLAAGRIEAICTSEERRSVVKLDRSGTITITATNNGVVRTMALASTVPEITIGNQYVNSATFGSPKAPLADNHWLAFYSLSSQAVVCDLPTQAAACPKTAAKPAMRHDPNETTIACSNSQYP